MDGIANISPELNDINIIKRIGKTLENIIGFEVNHYESSKIRFLVSMKVEQIEPIIKGNHNELQCLPLVGFSCWITIFF